MRYYKEAKGSLAYIIQKHFYYNRLSEYVINYLSLGNAFTYIGFMSADR